MMHIVDFYENHTFNDFISFQQQMEHISSYIKIPEAHQIPHKVYKTRIK